MKRRLSGGKNLIGALCLWRLLLGSTGVVAGRRLLKAEPPKISLPVLCVGNFTVGGAGKTPTAIAFASGAKARGLNPGIVSRGYGGAYKGLHVVDPAHDSARYVGDEPLLLARHASVALCPDRLKAARHLQTLGCDFIIMDDGFQSARLLPIFRCWLLMPRVVLAMEGHTGRPTACSADRPDA